MKRIRQVSFEEIVQAFLRTEWDYREIPDKDESRKNMVFSPNLDNEDENLERLQMLRSFRAPIVDAIPDDAVWYEVECDKESLLDLRVIKERDWFPLSRGTGKMEAASTFLHERIIHDQTLLEVVNAEGKVMSTHDLRSHICKVRGILPEVGEEFFDTYLIALSNEVTSISTLLDGNHRAVAIYIRCFITQDLDSFFPFKMYEGTTSSQCIWCW